MTTSRNSDGTQHGTPVPLSLPATTPTARAWTPWSPGLEVDPRRWPRGARLAMARPRRMTRPFRPLRGPLTSTAAAPANALLRHGRGGL